MDVQRRAARGELAEIFGPAALTQDKQHRTFGFAKVVDDTAAHLPPDLTAVLNAYAKGVNAYIDSRTNQNLPPEFLILQYKPRPWTPADSLAVGKLMAEYLSTSWQIDIMRAAMASLPKDKREALLPEVSPLDVLVVGKDRNAAKATNRASLPPTRRPNADVLAAVAETIENNRRSAELLGVFDHLPTFQASNNWVVSGKRTVSGKPLLANDPHIPASAPSVWYLTELSAPGMHVAGATFPGAPGIIVGHNDRIAWGVTNLGPDVQDVYIEKFDKDNAGRYLTPDGWRDAEIRPRVLRVHDALAGLEEPIRQDAGSNTGVAILNLNSTANSINLQLFNSAGAQQAQDTVVLNGFNQTTFLVKERAPFRQVLCPLEPCGSFTGSLVVTSAASQPVAAMVVGTDNGQIFSLPVVQAP